MLELQANHSHHGLKIFAINKNFESSDNKPKLVITEGVSKVPKNENSFLFSKLIINII